MMKVLSLLHGDNLSYKQLLGDRASVVFLGGFASNMEGSKATALVDFCRNQNFNLTLFDYLGHGKSSGNFTDYGISDWLENCATVLEKLTTGPQIIIGSSMGGWLMLLLAIRYPERVKALIGIAAAPDFTEDLIFAKMTNVEKNQLFSGKIVDYITDDRKCCYKIALNLIEDARKHFLLDKKHINITCPVRLLHGMADYDVPYTRSIELAEKISTNDVRIQLLKSSGHNMSDQESLATIFATINEVVTTR